jgi:Kinesin motor domain
MIAAPHSARYMCRNSKLTQLLANSLSGQAKVMMFLHVSPESSSFGESVSTLKFGARVSEITLGQAKRNVEAGSVLDAKATQVNRCSTSLVSSLSRAPWTRAICQLGKIR